MGTKTTKTKKEKTKMTEDRTKPVDIKPAEPLGNKMLINPKKGKRQMFYDPAKKGKEGMNWNVPSFGNITGIGRRKKQDAKDESK